MKTHGTCEKRGRGQKRQGGVRVEVEGHPWGNGNYGAGLVWHWDYATPRVGEGGSGRARVTS